MAAACERNSQPWPYYALNHWNYLVPQDQSGLALTTLCQNMVGHFYLYRYTRTARVVDGVK
jgi:hypothetical protein